MPVGRREAVNTLYRKISVPDGVTVVPLEDKRNNSVSDVLGTVVIGISHEDLTGKVVTLEQTMTPTQELIKAINDGTTSSLLWFPTDLTAYDLALNGPVLTSLRCAISGLRVTAVGALRIEVSL